MKLGVFWHDVRRLVILAFSVTALAATFAAAASSGEPNGDDLAAQVTIRRDTFGVPHILAPTEEAAAFGLGYACAEDHALLLGRLFLISRGEEAAYFGEKYADSDFQTHQFHIFQGAETGYAQLAPWVQRIFDGYAGGFNRFIAQHREQLPEWVKPVTGIDVLARGRHVLLMGFFTDLHKIDQIGKHASPATAIDAQALARGSNMWAIGKARSASGNALLMGNPHQPWEGAGIFYESHATVPGKLNISGCSLVGSPNITIGFNENLGWSHTVNLHETDIYELTLDPGDPRRYIYDGKPVALRPEEITVQVKSENGVVPRKRETFWSHYGPVVKIADGKAYAVKSTSLDENRSLEQWNLMGKARDIDEFRRVLDMQAIPMFNICYADKAGNCFYLFNGRFPQRPKGFKWDAVVPGDTSASEWNHMLPQNRLPQLVNPTGGYVQNCNSAPWYTNVRAPIDRRRFPPDLTPNFNSLRTQLSVEMLEGDEPFTLEKVKQCKYNTKLLLADRVKADVIKAARGETVDGVALDEAAQILESWDNKSSRDSKGAVLFALFWLKYGKEAARPYAVTWNERKPASTPSGIGEPETCRVALAAAVKEMKEKYGTLEVPWGDVHRLRRGKLDVPIGGYISEYLHEPEAGRDFKGGPYGDFGSFRVIDYRLAKDGKFVAYKGDSYVFAVEFTSPPTAYSICAYSQSDDPNSPHHTDQSVLFAKEQWKRAWFTEEDIAKHLERSYHP
jgi:acyl-homoserine-lactone acylase